MPGAAGHLQSMTQDLSPAQQTQMDNRDDSGKWKSKTHADVDDTGEVLGIDDENPHEALTTGGHTIDRDGSNPLAPNGREAIDSYEEIDKQVIELEHRAKTDEGTDYLDAHDALYEAISKHRSALERVSLTEEGREHLLSRAASAQEEISSWPGTDQDSLGTDWDELSDREKSHRLAVHSDVNHSSHAAQRGEGRQEAYDAFIKSTGAGEGATPVPAAEVRRRFPKGSRITVRYPQNGDKDNQRVSAERTVAINSSYQLVTRDAEGKSSTGTWSGRIFHRDDHGNYLAADPDMGGGVPYAIYTPQEDPK